MPTGHARHPAGRRPRNSAWWSLASRHVLWMLKGWFRAPGRGCSVAESPAVPGGVAPVVSKRLARFPLATPGRWRSVRPAAMANRHLADWASCRQTVQSSAARAPAGPRTFEVSGVPQACASADASGGVSHWLMEWSSSWVYRCLGLQRLSAELQLCLIIVSGAQRTQHVGECCVNAGAGGWIGAGNAIEAETAARVKYAVAVHEQWPLLSGQGNGQGIALGLPDIQRVMAQRAHGGECRSGVAPFGFQELSAGRAGAVADKAGRPADDQSTVGIDGGYAGSECGERVRGQLQGLGRNADSGERGGDDEGPGEPGVLDDHLRAATERPAPPQRV